MPRIVLLALALLTIHTTCPVASARETVATTQTSIEDGKIATSPKDSANSESFSAWGRLLGAMAVVVVLIVALGWLLKRLGGGRTLRSDGALQLIARANLSAKHQVFLMRMGERLVLIGAGPQGLSSLSEITDPAEANRLLQAAGMKVQNTEGGEA